MGLSLIAAVSDPSWAQVAFYSLMVLIGVNMIILVHELGHFLVARMCGVKCEKFYVWFDIFGWKLCKFRWGETEYGLGVLPLGGYVKMLGQEDNPARLREELERAKAARAAGGSSGGASLESRGNPGQATGSAASPLDIEAAEQALYDPRSYLSQSVPKRMAIISAGVIMNLAFALALAVVAYGLGVTQIECTVGTVFPGEAAWRADLRVGDRIVEVAGVPAKRFGDLLREISVGNIEHGAALVVMRRGKDGRDQRLDVDLEPDRIRVAPTIGISSGYTNVLSDRMPVFPGSPAALADPGFRAGDRIVGIDDQPVSNYTEIHAHLARHVEEPLTVRVERKLGDEGGASSSPREVTVEVAPAPMRRLGLVMEMDPITSIQDHSPAADAARPAFSVGDRIVRVVDEQGYRWDGDPMTLPDQLRRLAERNEPGHLITVTVSRKAGGEQEPAEVEIKVPLRRADWYSVPIDAGSPMTIPSLGIAYQVSNRIRQAQQGSRAAEAGVKGGDVVVEAKLVPPDKDSLNSEQLGQPAGQFKQREVSLKFGQNEGTWPSFVYALQQTLPGTQVELTLEGGRTLSLTPVDSTEWFNPERGFELEPLAFTQTAGSLAEAVVLGTQETSDAMTMIFRTVKSLGTGQVSMKGLSGPVGIVQMAYRYASRGMGDFLAFLCLISANLAVINFLPIPVLDGGHMVFLSYEAIRGKPPSEGVFVALSYLGLALILLLMIWVLGLDIGCIPRQ